MRYARCSLLALVATAASAVASAQAYTYWVPAAAHRPGVNGTEWRTELAMMTLCPTPATVQILLHTDDGVVSAIYTIDSGVQRYFIDVVAELTSGDSFGALELRSDQELIVTSRTFNQTGEGTFGQAFDGVLPEQGFGFGETFYLQHLKQNNVYRTNIGVLNMGADPLTVAVELYSLGFVVGSYQLEVPAGHTVQDNQPFSARFERDRVLIGRARLRVIAGSGAWAYASVVDNRTSDPTTVIARPGPECPNDIRTRLAAIDGMVVEEIATIEEGYRQFILGYEQPVDHDEPGAGTFDHYMTLLHKSYDAPMVVRTEGYQHNHDPDILYFITPRSVLTPLLGANELIIEHRFFGTSIPDPLDWSVLTIEQAAADHHRIVEAIRPLYSGAWVSTGGSKAGMTAVYYRRFYPDDVDATVAYVAPNSLGAPDDRYVDFLLNVGDVICREAIWTLQREALERREAMLPLLDAWATEWEASFARIGGLERAFESAVVELPFTFWQSRGESYCDSLPFSDASDEEIFDALEEFSSFYFPTDRRFEARGPYFFQAHTQLGYPALPEDHLQDLLTTDPLNLEEGLPPEGVPTTFDPGAMLDIASWVANEGRTLMFIYGEHDPWTAAAFELGDAVDSYLYIAPNLHHGAGIDDLSQEDQAEVLATLERWTGVTPGEVTPFEEERGCDSRWMEMRVGLSESN